MGNNKKTILVTGSSGLIGSEVCLFFYRKGFAVKGIDNNQRAVFFGPQGDTTWNAKRLSSLMSDFTQYTIDIRDREAVLKLLKTIRPDIIVHAAAQPSHDKAAAIVFDDFDINAAGTLNLLEGARRFCISSPFIYMSTNKVYGDLPNTIKLKELKTRWEYDDPVYAQGIPESFSIDQSKHSLFGASKLAADILVQEYGRYFGMSTCCLRAGCLTGPNHAGVELHGFLNYLVKCNLEGKEYKIFGYKGKQVRDNLHAQDVAEFIFQFYCAPRSAEVYNIGGGKDNACSVIEAIAATEKLSGKKQQYTYLEQNRIADHICYYSDLRKIQSHYPQWKIKKPLSDILKEIMQSWKKRL